MIGLVMKGYEGGITLGQRKMAIFTATGPASYNTTTKDPLTFTLFPYIDFVNDCVTTDKLYVVTFVPSAAGPRSTWSAMWISVATGLEVTPGTNLSTENIISQAFGGDF